jgi:hypothetical protein
MVIMAMALAIPLIALVMLTDLIAAHVPTIDPALPIPTISLTSITIQNLVVTMMVVVNG